MACNMRRYPATRINLRNGSLRPRLVLGTAGIVYSTIISLCRWGPWPIRPIGLVITSTAIVHLLVILPLSLLLHLFTASSAELEVESRFGRTQHIPRSNFGRVLRFSWLGQGQQ
jgi:hypothetical protein